MYIDVSLEALLCTSIRVEYIVQRTWVGDKRGGEGRFVSVLCLTSLRHSCFVSRGLLYDYIVRARFPFFFFFVFRAEQDMRRWGRGDG